MGPLEHLPGILKEKDDEIAKLKCELQLVRAKATAFAQAQRLALAQFGGDIGLEPETPGLSAEEAIVLTGQLTELTNAISEEKSSNPLIERFEVALRTALAEEQKSAARHAKHLLESPPENAHRIFSPYILAMIVDPHLRRALLNVIVRLEG